MNLQGPWFAVALTAPSALTVVEPSLASGSDLALGLHLIEA